MSLDEVDGGVIDFAVEPMRPGISDLTSAVAPRNQLDRPGALGSGLSCASAALRGVERKMCFAGWNLYALDERSTILGGEEIDRTSQMLHTSRSQSHEAGVESVRGLRSDHTAKRVHGYETCFEFSTSIDGVPKLSTESAQAQQVTRSATGFESCSVIHPMSSAVPLRGGVWT